MGFKSSKQKIAKPLTEVELEMMNIIWNIHPCSVAQIMEELAKGRDLAYTSVSTIVRILEQKKFLKSQKEGRGHLYSPLVKKEDYQNTSIHHIVHSVFDGAPASLVRQLLESDSLSRKELEDIRAILNQRV